MRWLRSGPKSVRGGIASQVVPGPRLPLARSSSRAAAGTTAHFADSLAYLACRTGDANASNHSNLYHHVPTTLKQSLTLTLYSLRGQRVSVAESKPACCVVLEFRTEKKWCSSCGQTAVRLLFTSCMHSMEVQTYSDVCSS